MTWNWECSAWPQFVWRTADLCAMEASFLHQSGVLVGATRHLSIGEQQALVIHWLTEESLKTSEIEGEYLDRESVQSSIQHHFGFETVAQLGSPAERGMARMMTDLYTHFAEPLSHSTLQQWHQLIMEGQDDPRLAIGCYRQGTSSMQIVSGPIDKRKVHFEAPPAACLKKEMDRFLAWFSETGPTGTQPLPALTRAGIAHLYFVSLHPFEDGNGRIARVIAEKALAQSMGAPTLLALAQTICMHRKAYYAALEKNNKMLEITGWLAYFAKTILDAQRYSERHLFFLIEKTKFYDRVRGQFNPRQAKVIARLFQAGMEGFQGGLSAKKYRAITQTSKATTTRDLQALVEIGALLKTGELKKTRYFLNLEGLKQGNSTQSV